MTDDLDKRIHDVQLRLAHINGRVAGMVDNVLCGDPVMRELVRARAWLASDTDIEIGVEGGKLTGLPEGWPPDVSDPEALVDRDVAARRDRLVSSILSRPDKQEIPDEPSASPSVARLRTMIGGE